LYFTAENAKNAEKRFYYLKRAKSKWPQWNSFQIPRGKHGAQIRPLGYSPIALGLKISNGLKVVFSRLDADGDRTDRDSEKEQNLIFPFKDDMEKIPER
jgi:hypothetical protein